MAERIFAVDENFDFPAPVAARQAARLGDAMTAEGKAVEARVANGNRDRLAPLAVFRTVLRTRGNTQPVTVAFCGDSYTFGHTTAYDKRWVTMLGTLAGAPVGTLDTPTPLSNGLQIINAAQNGMRSTNYLDAAKTAKLVALNPTLIVHMIGANDWTNAVSPAQTEANLRAKIAELDAAITTPHVHLLMLGHARWDSRVVGTPWTWAQYGEGMRRISDDKPATVAFADLTEHFKPLGIPGTDPLALSLGDEVHLNDSGQVEYLDRVSDILKLTPAAIVAPPKLPVLLAADSFDRSALGSTETGSFPWTAWGGSVAVNNGAMSLGAPTVPQLGTIASVQTGKRNGTYTADLTVNSGLVFGLNAEKTQGYVVIYRASTFNEYRLSTYNVNYTETGNVNAFANYLATKAMPLGSRVTAEVTDGLIVVSVDGVEIIRHADTRNYQGGEAGVVSAAVATVGYWEKKVPA